MAHVSTVSINGGPAVPLPEAIRVVKKRMREKLGVAGPGHNLPPDSGAERLRSLVDRIERLLEEKAALTSDIADIYTEAKNAGYLPAAIRALIRERAEDADKRREREDLMDLYRSALGMLSDTPLGAAAMAKAG